MSTRRFCVAIAVLCMTLSSSVRPAMSQTVDAWLYTYHVPFYGPTRMGAGTALLGHVPQIGVVGEVAVTQATISVGDEVPLPTYADGSQAQEGEVFWTTQLLLAEFNAPSLTRYKDGDYVVATFNGRHLVAASGQINTGNPISATTLQVLVNVIAVRSSTTATKRQSMGSLKARYR